MWAEVKFLYSYSRAESVALAAELDYSIHAAAKQWICAAAHAHVERQAHRAKKR